MAKSKTAKFARKHTGTIIAVGGLALVLGLAAYAFSDRQRLYSRLEEKVLGNGGSGSAEPVDASTDSATPEAPSGNQNAGNPSGIIPQLRSFLDRARQPSYTQQIPPTFHPLPQQAPSKPVFSTALSNYTKIIQNAIDSGYSGIPSRSVHAPSGFKGHTRNVSKSNIQKGSPRHKNIIRSQLKRSNNNFQKTRPKSAFFGNYSPKPSSSKTNLKQNQFKKTAFHRRYG